MRGKGVSKNWSHPLQQKRRGELEDFWMDLGVGGTRATGVLFQCLLALQKIIAQPCIFARGLLPYF